MKTRTFFYVFTITAMLVGLSSCLSRKMNKIVRVYDGPVRETTSICVIDRGERPKAKEEFTLVFKIDSVFVLSGKFGVVPKRCEFLPGVHTIEIEHRALVFPYDLGRYLVTFCAQAGKTYYIKANTDQNTQEVDIYVTDANSGDRIESTTKRRFSLINNQQQLP